MSTVVEIQEAIARLNENERGELRLWLNAYEEDEWDRQITADAASGKLDFLREEAETAKRKGRPRKGEQRPPEKNVLDIQREQTLQEILAALPIACGIGAKKNSKGYIETWIGYKIHIITGEGGIPLVCLLTSAWVHDSQVAIALLNILDGTVTCLYVLMDAAYDAAAIGEYCRSLGYVPIIDINPRNNQALAQALQFLHIEPPEHVHYRQRSASERVNSRLKDEFGGRYVRVRGHAKVMAHLMFGILALTVDQIVRLVQ